MGSSRLETVQVNGLNSSMAPSVSYKFHSPGAQNAVLTVEFLRNDEAWGDELPFGNPHFRFGKVKAQVILAAWDIIEEYVGAVGLKPALFQVQDRYVSETSFVTVKVARQGEFVNRAGILIEKHYLQFAYGHQTWGFGLTKAQALLSYRDQIEFLAKS
jgi:hypothetical protein